MQLALPRHPGVLEVAHLVVQPLEALAHDGLVAGALVERRRQPLLTARLGPRPQHARGVAERAAGDGPEDETEQRG